jgi:phosphoglycerate dehydrogenase-like enzyme
MTAAAVKLVAFPALDAGWSSALRGVSSALTVVSCDTEDKAARELVDADAFFGTITPRLLKAATRLRWIQAHRAGLEHYMFPELIEHPAVLTNMRGIYGDLVPEHALALMLALARGLPRYAGQQKDGRWETHEVALLAGQTLGIVGLGSIGRGIARRAAAFDMRIVAVDPVAGKAAEVDTLWRQDGLDRLLREADWVVIAAPHTPETVKMFRRPQFQAMKRTAYLVNVGRGAIVDLDDLVAALGAGEIAGAGLDVFEIEPLPSGHPLWGFDNVVITPHVAAETRALPGRWLGVLLDNAGRFVRGEPLQNVVDKRRWF